MKTRFALTTIIFFGLFLSASAFTGPTQNPPGGNGILIASTTGALGISTTTFYLGNTPAQWIFRSLGANKDIIFLPSGDVGIATTTPSEKLEVLGNIKATSFIGSFSGTVVADNITPGVFSTCGSCSSGSFSFPASLGVATTSNVSLPQSLSVYGGGYFTGNVGFATSAPGEMISIVGGNILLGGPSESAARNLIFGRNLTSATAQGGRLYTVNGGVQTEKIRLTRDATGFINSDVGVGTSTPSYQLEVIGDLRVSATSTFSGNFSFGGAAVTNLNMNGNDISAINKIDVSTIDPLYEIQGKKFATYVSSISGGVKEEFIGKGKLFSNNKGSYEEVLDFDNVKENSDLWVWRKVIDFGKDGVDVLVTPYGEPASIYYLIDGNKIIFRGDKPVEFSYRLVGKRFDWLDWPTYAKDQNSYTNLIIK